MKKEYLIGGLLGVVLCGVVAYAVMTFIGMEGSETARQLAERLPPPVPLQGAVVQETRQPAKDPLPDQGKAANSTPTSGLSDSRKTDELKAEGRTGMKITLKNGRSIIADSCRDVSGKLLCIVSGGSMQIDRQEIASITDVKLQSSSSDRTAEPSDGKADDRKTADNTLAGAKGAQPNDGKLVRGLTADKIKRLDQITERKAVLQPEREKLIKEREQLHEDVKNMGMIRKQEQYDDLKKRIADLEARINSFNDEGKKLNEEEKAIMDSAAVR